MTLAKRKILIAGMGTSPGVLTNVVWALAHGEKPVVPDEIVVFITKNGDFVYIEQGEEHTEDTVRDFIREHDVSFSLAFMITRRLSRQILGL